MKDKLLCWFFKIAGWVLIAAGVSMFFLLLFVIAAFPNFDKTPVADFLRPIVNLF